MSQAPSPLNDASPPSVPPLELSAEQRMLLEMRDTLYEGSWSDFVRDLEARLNGQPHVFEVVPDAPHFAETIRNHLRIIGELQAWEQANHRTLHSRPTD